MLGVHIGLGALHNEAFFFSLLGSTLGPPCFWRLANGATRGFFYTPTFPVMGQ